MPPLKEALFSVAKFFCMSSILTISVSLVGEELDEEGVSILDVERSREGSGACGGEFPYEGSRAGSRRVTQKPVCLVQALQTVIGLWGVRK